MKDKTEMLVHRHCALMGVLPLAHTSVDTEMAARGTLIEVAETVHHFGAVALLTELVLLFEKESH